MTLVSVRDRRCISICIAASLMLHVGALAFLRLPSGGSFLSKPAMPMEIRFRALSALAPTAGQRNPRVVSANPKPSVGTHGEAGEPRSSANPQIEPESSSPEANLEASRAVERELGRQKYGFTESSPLNVTHSDPRLILARGMAQAARPDCRIAYSGMGPLAIPFLVVAALTDSGCSW